MFSGCRLGVGGWGGPVVTWRPCGPIWSAAAGERICNVRGCVGWRPRGGTVRVGCTQGPEEVGPGSSGVCAGGVGGPPDGMGVPRGAGPLSGVCGLSSVGGGEGCPAGGFVAGVCWCSTGGGGPCRGAPGCARWWACVGLRMSSERAGAWAGIVRWGVLCLCMCPLAAARLRGLL